MLKKFIEQFCWKTWTCFKCLHLFFLFNKLWQFYRTLFWYYNSCNAKRNLFIWCLYIWKATDFKFTGLRPHEFKKRRSFVTKYNSVMSLFFLALLFDILIEFQHCINHRIYLSFRFYFRSYKVHLLLARVKPVLFFISQH